MHWKWMANFVAAFHGVWVLVFLAGPFLGLRSSFWRGIHLVVLVVTVLSWSSYCPLTSLENLFNSRFDPAAGYQTGFLEHLLAPILNLRNCGATMAWGVRGWLLLWGLIYGIVWARELGRQPKR